jgi:hypothetical protein
MLFDNIYYFIYHIISNNLNYIKWKTKSIQEQSLKTQTK